MNTIVANVTKDQIRTDLPDIRVGDTVKVLFKVVEGKKERVQAFEGVVTKIQNGGISRNFTVRKLVGGVGIEKSYFINSPLLTELKVIREGKARRAKLFYLRGILGSKASRIKARDPRFK